MHNEQPRPEHQQKTGAKKHQTVLSTVFQATEEQARHTHTQLPGKGQEKERERELVRRNQKRRGQDRAAR